MLIMPSQSLEGNLCTIWNDKTNVYKYYDASAKPMFMKAHSLYDIDVVLTLWRRLT